MVQVSGLQGKVAWQDLKDHMKQAGRVSQLHISNEAGWGVTVAQTQPEVEDTDDTDDQWRGSKKREELAASSSFKPFWVKPQPSLVPRSLQSRRFGFFELLPHLCGTVLLRCIPAGK
jgi:hypothetical protein